MSVLAESLGDLDKIWTRVSGQGRGIEGRVEALGLIGRPTKEPELFRS
jgi:hypothetical protein